MIGLYAVYFIMVGMKGNAGAMVTNIQQDGKNFIPWILAILVLRALYSSDTLKPLITPFIVLAGLTFFLKNYATVAGQVNQLLPANAQIPP
jgi:hypothetical protein